MSLRLSRRAAVAALPLLLVAGCLPFGRPASARFTRAPAPVAAVRLDSVTLEGGQIVQPVHLRDARGLAVDLLVKRPLATDSGARRPLVLLLGGHHAGRDAARLIPDTRGHVVVALSYPYAGPHKVGFFGALRAAPAIRGAVFDTPPAIRLALDWLLAQPWADSTRVEGIGASLGTPFMTVAAALDPRITRLWSVHGAGDNYRLLAHGTRAYVKLKPARSLAVRSAAALVAARDLDADKWVARVAPRPFVMINATEDERLPREAIDKLWTAAREPKEIVWLPGKHVQRNRPEIVRALLDTVLARMGDGAGPAVGTSGGR